jgi:hypothetical protein
MLNGIVKEILVLNDLFFENIFVENSLAKEEASEKLQEKVETYIDFLYRDDPILFEKLLAEATVASEQDDNITCFLDNVTSFDILYGYIQLSLGYDYNYKGEVFKTIFERG